MSVAYLKTYLATFEVLPEEVQRRLSSVREFDLEIERACLFVVLLKEAALDKCHFARFVFSFLFLLWVRVPNHKLPSLSLAHASPCSDALHEVAALRSQLPAQGVAGKIKVRV